MCIRDSLGGRGIFGVELFVKGDDVYFSEVSPRPHDTGLVTMATQRLSEFEMHARAILGLPVDVTLASPGASAVIYGQLDEKGIGFEYVAQALALPETDIRLFGKPESFRRRRMGVVTATADDVATARERAVRAASIVTPVPGRPARRGVVVPLRAPGPPAPPKPPVGQRPQPAAQRPPSAQERPQAAGQRPPAAQQRPAAEQRPPAPEQRPAAGAQRPPVAGQRPQQPAPRPVRQPAPHSATPNGRPVTPGRSSN